MDITARLSSIRGERLGVPKLVVTLSFKCNTQGSFRLLNLVSEIRVVNTPQLFGAGARNHFVGYGVYEQESGGQLSNSVESTCVFGIALSPYVLQRIEEVRRGGDIYLLMRFLGLAADLGDGSTPLPKAFVIPTVRAENWSSNYNLFKIAQSDWIKVLKDLGYGDHFLIEVPLRGLPKRKDMERSLAHLASAWDHFNDGKDEETLGSCYKAFEVLAKQIDMEGPDQNAFEKLLGSIGDKAKKDKLKLLMRSICDYFHLGRHEQADGARVDHSDAEYALILSQATLSYIAKTRRPTNSKE